MDIILSDEKIDCISNLALFRRRALDGDLFETQLKK